MKSSYITEFLDNIGLEIYEAQEIFEVYVEDTEKAISNLKKSLEHSDWDSLKRIVHSIKGSSGNANVKDVYEATANLDLKLKNGKLENIHEDVEKIILLFNEAKKTIEETFNKNSKNIKTL